MHRAFWEKRIGRRQDQGALADILRLNLMRQIHNTRGRIDDQNNAGTCSFADSAGVQLTAGTGALDDLDTIMFIYHGTATTEWAQLATSNN